MTTILKILAVIGIGILLLIGIGILLLLETGILKKKAELQPPTIETPTLEEKLQIEPVPPQPEPFKDKGEIKQPLILAGVSFAPVQIDAIVKNKNLTNKETYLIKEILNNRIPVYDLSKTNPEQIIQEYGILLAKLGDDFRNINEGNLALRIKNQSIKLLK